MACCGISAMCSMSLGDGHLSGAKGPCLSSLRSESGVAYGSCYGRLGSRLKRRWFSRNNHRVMSFAGEFIGFSVVKLRSCWIELEDSAIQMFERHTFFTNWIFSLERISCWAPVGDAISVERSLLWDDEIALITCRRKRWSSWAIATSSDETLGLQWLRKVTRLGHWALQKPKLWDTACGVGLPALTSFERLVSVFFLAHTGISSGDGKKLFFLVLASWVNPKAEWQLFRI